MTEPALTVRQVAAYLNVAPKLVYRLAQTRDLPGFKVAGIWRMKRTDIDAWIEEQKRQPILLTSSSAVQDGRPTSAVLDADQMA